MRADALTHASEAEAEATSLPPRRASDTPTTPSKQWESPSQK